MKLHPNLLVFNTDDQRADTIGAYGKWHNDGHPLYKACHETHFVFPGDLATTYQGHAMTFEVEGHYIHGHNTELFCEKAMEFLQRAPQEQGDVLKT